MNHHDTDDRQVRRKHLRSYAAGWIALVVLTIGVSILIALPNVDLPAVPLPDLSDVPQ